MRALLTLCLIISVTTLSAVMGGPEGAGGGGRDGIQHEIRKRRSESEPTILGLTQAQHDLSLELHNHYRRLINASNIEKMRYNMVLAEMAYNLTESCWMRHWWPASWPNQPFITYDTGQNLYAGTSTKLKIRVGIGAWYDEINVYDYKENTCTTDQCGHFTQLVWADSNLVGCAYSFCPDFIKPDGVKSHNFHYYACNYGHAGNVQGRIPWKEGPACTGCDSGYFWCDNEEPRGLCVSKYNGTTSVPPGITCATGGCLNGGVLGCDCKCKCTAEFQGKFCEKACVSDPGCGTDYPKSYCKDYPDPMLWTCPGLCGLCGEADPVACVFSNTSPDVVTRTQEPITKDKTGSDEPITKDGTTSDEAIADDGITTVPTDMDVTTESSSGSPSPFKCSSWLSTILLAFLVYYTCTDKEDFTY